MNLQPNLQYDEYGDIRVIAVGWVDGDKLMCYGWEPEDTLFIYDSKPADENNIPVVMYYVRNINKHITGWVTEDQIKLTM